MISRERFMLSLQNSHMFLFCHKTSEIAVLPRRSVSSRLFAPRLRHRIPQRIGGKLRRRRIHSYR